VSISRIAAYEKRLIDVVGQHFARDPLLPVLVQFAREDNAGFDAPLHAGRREVLLQAELDAFDAQCARLGRRARADAVYGMIEHSASAVPEVARNLFRLTASGDEWPTGTALLSVPLGEDQDD
jgi:hypothetical protein